MGTAPFSAVLGLLFWASNPAGAKTITKSGFSPARIVFSAQDRAVYVFGHHVEYTYDDDQEGGGEAYGQPSIFTVSVDGSSQTRTPAAFFGLEDHVAEEHQLDMLQKSYWFVDKTHGRVLKLDPRLPDFAKILAATLHQPGRSAVTGKTLFQGGAVTISAPSDEESEEIEVLGQRIVGYGGDEPFCVSVAKDGRRMFFSRNTLSCVWEPGEGLLWKNHKVQSCSKGGGCSWRETPATDMDFVHRIFPDGRRAWLYIKHNAGGDPELRHVDASGKTLRTVPVDRWGSALELSIKGGYYWTVAYNGTLTKTSLVGNKEAELKTDCRWADLALEPDGSLWTLGCGRVEKRKPDGSPALSVKLNLRAAR